MNIKESNFIFIIQICISSIRISLERPLSEEEIQYFIQSLKEIIAIIRK